MVYLAIALPLMIAFAALAVDVGRLQLAKSELQAVADAAARYGASATLGTSSPSSAALANVQAVVNQSKVDGGTLTVNSADVQVGTYAASTNTFKPISSGDCVKVTLHQKLIRSGSARC